MWEDDASKRFDLAPELSIGVEDGDENYVLGRIFDIAVDSRGRILVLDNGFTRVQVYDSLGVYVRSIGAEGEGPGHLAFPTAIDVDPVDDVYVASAGRISSFDPDGRFLDEFRYQHPESYVRSFRVNPGVGLYLSCLDLLEQKVLHKYNDAHEPVLSFCDTYAVRKDIDIRIEQAFAGGFIDLTRDGRILYTQMTPYEIRIFSSDGDLLLVVYRENDFVDPPEPIEVRPDGSMNVTVRSGSSGIIAMDDGRFINVVRAWRDAKTMVICDLFDSDGHLLKTLRLERNIIIKCGNADRLYAIETETYPKVVRYRLRY